MTRYDDAEDVIGVNVCAVNGCRSRCRTVNVFAPGEELSAPPRAAQTKTLMMGSPLPLGAWS